MELELQGWKVKAALVALAVLVVTAPLARAVASNKGRAEDWHKRAIVAEESVGGLRAVIAERSRELNRRTIQANRLAARVDANGTALQRSKVSVGALTRRQRELARNVARVSTERDRLRSRLAAAERIGVTLSACAKDAATSPRGTRTEAADRSRLAACKRASERFDALRQAR
ncbi:MAG: hypothetical protein M5U27_10245 [Gaiella sp.]|nr:hypothetical protein [Gaiella sp.]